MHASGRQTVTVEYIETAALDADGLALLSQTLSDEERARAARFHFERDRSVYIVGHALMRDMLARAVGGSAHDFAFTTGAHGKPEAVLAASAPRLRINLSHTRGLAAVAMTQDVDVGVDVEWMSRDRDLLNIAERFFAVDERRQLALAAETDRRDCFFAFWTLKEAYIKAISSSKRCASPSPTMSTTIPTTGTFCTGVFHTIMRSRSRCATRAVLRPTCRSRQPISTACCAARRPPVRTGFRANRPRSTATGPLAVPPKEDSP